MSSSITLYLVWPQTYRSVTTETLLTLQITLPLTDVRDLTTDCFTNRPHESNRFVGKLLICSLSSLRQTQILFKGEDNSSDNCTTAGAQVLFQQTPISPTFHNCANTSSEIHLAGQDVSLQNKFNASIVVCKGFIHRTPFHIHTFCDLKLQPYQIKIKKICLTPTKFFI